MRRSPGLRSQVLSQPGQCRLECHQGALVIAGVRESRPPVAAGAGQGAIPRRDGTGVGGVGRVWQGAGSRGTDAEATPRPSPPSPPPAFPESPVTLSPQSLSPDPIATEPSVCSFTSNPPEVGGPAVRELRAPWESRPWNDEPQPPARLDAGGPLRPPLWSTQRSPAGHSNTSWVSLPLPGHGS